MLFAEGHVLTNPNTYTGEVALFLKRCKSVRYGEGAEDVAAFGGDGGFKDARSQATSRKAPGKMKDLVANIVAYMKVYRNETT